MRLPSPQDEREERFRRLFGEIGPDVLRFVRRRCLPAQADDVVAEAFVVVWRRLDDVPDDQDDQRAWLFGIARGCLANELRGVRRREALAVRIAEAPGDRSEHASTDVIAARIDLARAWRLLPAAHQEAIALTAWDGLTSNQAAQVLDISPLAYRARLSRARRVLRKHLALAPSNSAMRLQPAQVIKGTL